jgi:hypothetical protein
MGKAVAQGFPKGNAGRLFYGCHAQTGLLDKLGMKGINPDETDKERATDEAAWFKAYPVITTEEWEKNRAIGLKNKRFLDGNGCKNDLSKTGMDVVSEKKGS